MTCEYHHACFRCGWTAMRYDVPLTHCEVCRSGRISVVKMPVAPAWFRRSVNEGSQA